MGIADEGEVGAVGGEGGDGRVRDVAAVAKANGGEVGTMSGKGGDGRVGDVGATGQVNMSELGVATREADDHCVGHTAVKLDAGGLLCSSGLACFTQARGRLEGQERDDCVDRLLAQFLFRRERD